MGFTAIFLQFSFLLSIQKFPQTYAQFTQCYPQSIVTKKKRVAKESYFPPTRHSLILAFSVIHSYNCALSVNTNSASTIFP